MAKKTIHKVFGHIILYLIIILGIFALQFRNQSIISRNFGQLRLTLSEIKGENGQKKFKDSFYISYKGISLFANTETPIVVTDKKKKEKTLVFTGWKELSDSAFELYFNNSLVLLCGLTGANKETFTVSAAYDDTFASAAIPFKFSDSYSVMETTAKRAVLSGKTQQTSLSAPLIEGSRLIITPIENSITYANYEPSREFLFEKAAGYDLAQKSVYDASVQNLKNALVSQFSSASDTLNEQIVVSYITEMASRNKYTEAVSSIPDSFTNGTRRTYLSAPYLNNLAVMNKSLKMQQDNLIYKLNYALEKNSLDIFKADSLYNFLMTQNQDTVRKLLALPGKLEKFEPSVSEAAGLVATYTGLTAKNAPYASDLKPYMNTCIDVIRKACVIESDALFIMEKDEKLSLPASVHTAMALISYGSQISDQDIISTGMMLCSSQLLNIELLDLRLIAELYAAVEAGSTYYPHIEVIGLNNDKPVWIWTAAKSVSMSTAADGTITLQTSFPAGYTHYMILNNVEPFTAIEIYDMMFRTDPRFESYNSSGYVYEAETKTLFLKFRHKTYTEKVRLFYSKQEAEPDIPAPDTTGQPQPGSNAGGIQDNQNTQSTAPGAANQDVQGIQSQYSSGL